ncbi:MAG TPA: hypothetical protein VHA79_02245 [Mycobacteriales bacterium]|jgi:hypothetical protein|nr:hypothetical protein [Mycobacteriales bacterium]
MSSVLYPVGPLPPKVYWVRRLLVLGVPLILILIIAVSCTGGGGGKSPTHSTGAGANPTTSATDSATADPNAACVPGDLSAVLDTSADGSIYPVGASPVFTATITNVSSTTCKFTSSAANEKWTVWTGPTKFWTTAGCPQSDTSSTKKLSPQASTQLSITWDGKQLDPGCKAGATAEAGTYVLHARLDGVKAQQVIFHFHTNTQ